MKNSLYDFAKGNAELRGVRIEEREMIHTLISHNKLTWLVIFYYFFTKEMKTKQKNNKIGI
jgi:hypothetical protein